MPKKTKTSNLPIQLTPSFGERAKNSARHLDGRRPRNRAANVRPDFGRKGIPHNIGDEPGWVSMPPVGFFHPSRSCDLNNKVPAADRKYINLKTLWVIEGELSVTRLKNPMLKRGVPKPNLNSRGKSEIAAKGKSRRSVIK